MMSFKINAHAQKTSQMVNGLVEKKMATVHIQHVESKRIYKVKILYVGHPLCSECTPSYIYTHTDMSFI